MAEESWKMDGIEQKPKDEEGFLLWGRRFEKGGWKATPSIFGNEVCEKIGAVGLQVNLVSYLVQQMHMQTAEAANTITNFGGTAAVSPLLGAFIADSYLGRFYTIILGSILFTFGTFLLTIQAVLPSLRPSCTNNPHHIQICQHPSKSHLGFLYLAFIFLATGSGGIRPCVAAFGADQFDPVVPKQKKQLYNFFNWYYFVMAASILVTVTVLVYVQDNVGWGWGFGIPAMCMVLSVIAFVIGSMWYRKVDPSGSPFTRIVQVIVAAYRKRHLDVPHDLTTLYEKKECGEILLHHTEQFKMLDKAAVVTEEDNIEGKVNPWRLSRVHHVEETKALMRIVPICMSGVLVFAASSQQGTFWVQQGRSMERTIGSKFQIPPGSMTAFGTLTVLIFVPIYDRAIMPFARRMSGQERGITTLQRVGIGLFISILVMVMAGIVEMKRRTAAVRAGLEHLPHSTVPMSVFWLVPQYCLVGLMESFLSIGSLEFFYDQSPDSMRSMSTAILWIVIAAGSYLSTILVSLVQKITSHRGLHPGWLSNNINTSRLDYFYWFLSFLLALNFVAFQFLARWFKYKEVDLSPKDKSLSTVL